jgi:hypothetical protein
MGYSFRGWGLERAEHTQLVRLKTLALIVLVVLIALAFIYAV